MFSNPTLASASGQAKEAIARDLQDRCGLAITITHHPHTYLGYADQEMGHAFAVDVDDPDEDLFMSIDDRQPGMESQLVAELLRVSDRYRTLALAAASRLGILAIDNLQNCPASAANSQ